MANYSSTILAANSGSMRRSGPARTLLASQGRAVQQGPANFSGRARPGYQRPGTNAQPYQPADRAFARGPGPAPAPPPPPRAQGGAGNTGTVAQPGPGQTTTPTHGPGHVAGPASIANQFSGTAMAKPAYNGMMRGNLSTLNLQDALRRSQGTGQSTIKSQSAQAADSGLAPASQSDLASIAADPSVLGQNNSRTAQVLPQQPLTSNASVLGGAPANMAAGGAGTAQGSVQGQLARSPQEFVSNLDEGAGNIIEAGRDVLGGNLPGVQNDDGSQYNVNDGTPLNYYGTVTAPTAEYLPGGGPGGIGGGTGNGSPSTPFGAALRDILKLAGGDLSAASGAMSETDMENIRRHFGESSGAYSDIIKRSRDIMDPAKMAEAEAAARGDLYSGINQQRDAAQRQMLASAGRGGYQSSGAQTGIYNAAMQAASAGERGLAQDAFGRRQAATQLGISGLGAGGSALENLLQSGFTSNKELMAMLLGAGKQAKDNLNPFSFTNL